jgi:transposase
VHTSLVGKEDGTTPSRYGLGIKAKAIRLVGDHAGDYDSQWAATSAIAGRLGMSAETLRKWIRQAEVDSGESPGVPTETAREIREQELGQQREPVAPGRCLAQLLGQPPAIGTGQVSQVDGLPAELVHGQAQQRVGSSGARNTSR